MSKIKLSKEFIKSTVKLALNEDLYPSGDITSSLIDNDKIINVKLISNENAIVGGLLFAKQTFEALAYASEELNNNHSFVVEIMKINGGCLTYAVDEFKKDKEIVLEAIKNGGTIYCADPILKKDREFSLIAI